MRRLLKPIALLTCLSLLTLQLSGLHMHVDAEGYVGGPQHRHTHSQSMHDGHRHSETGGHAHQHGGSDPTQDFDGTRDVALYDLTIGSSKIPLAVLCLLFLFCISLRPVVSTCAEIVYPVLSGRYTRWRPPLRAPPKPA